jgi:hypothetical protein
MVFDGALGLVLVAEGLQMQVIEFAVFFGHDDDLLGVECVLHRAKNGWLRAGFVGAVDFDTVWCRHLCVLSD